MEGKEEVRERERVECIFVERQEEEGHVVMRGG